MNIKGISVIIPNYNGRSLLEQTIPPLLEALNNVNIANEIIVVDDCSTDNSANYILEFFKEIIVLTNEINRGFSATINKGIFKAKHSHLLLLNSDVKLEKEYFTALLKYFDKPDTFGVMGKIIGWDNGVIQDGGKYPYFHGVKIKTSGNYIPLNPSPDSWLYSMYLSGANAFVDREKLLLLKGFDEIFSPYYIEDYDLSLRAWRLGWKCYYEHFAVCRHKTSSTIKSNHKRREVRKIYNRNKMYLHAIHLDGFTRFLWYLQLLFEALVRVFTFQFSYITSLYIFLKNKKHVTVSGKNFSELSKRLGGNISVREVTKLIKTSLVHNKISRF